MHADLEALGRHEQPLPTRDPRSVPVLPHALAAMGAHFDYAPDTAARIAPLLAARIEVGTARYGQPLWTYDGRDVVRDLREELLDAYLYATSAGLSGALDDITAGAVLSLVLAALDVLTAPPEPCADAAQGVTP
jgi:hypothetical protein